MATVQLADIIDVTVFQDLPSVNSPEKTALYESGIVTGSPLLNGLASSAGKIAELPFWNDIDASVAPNLSTDNPADVAVPAKITQGEQISRKAFLNKGLSASDLATELAMGGDAMQHIRNRIDAYWTKQWQYRLIAASNGVLADNVANDASDMVVDVAVESIAGQTTATKFSRNNFTDAVYTMGDAASALGAIAVHSAVMSDMVKNDDIVYVEDSKGMLSIPTYMGLRVIVDDGLSVVAGVTDGFKYTSVLYGQGAFGYGNGMPANPVAVEREEAQGEGAGIETLWTRKTWILHPFGFQSTGVPAGNSLTPAELALAGTWDRVVARKNVPLGFLITN